MGSQKGHERFFSFLAEWICKKHLHEQRDFPFFELPEVAGKEPETIGDSYTIAVTACPTYKTYGVVFLVTEDRQRTCVSGMTYTIEQNWIDRRVHAAQHSDGNGELKGVRMKQIHISWLLRNKLIAVSMARWRLF